TTRLRVGMFPVAMSRFLPIFFKTIKQMRPGLMISMIEGIEHKLLTMLSAGELDCVFGRIVADVLTDDLHQVVLYHEPTVVVCGPDHPVRHTDFELTFGKYDWILPSTEGALYNMVASRLALMSLPAPRVLAETTSISATVELLGVTQLLAIMPKTMALSYANAGQVALAPMPDLGSPYPVGIIYRAEP